jgi:hypothetical protein
MYLTASAVPGALKLTWTNSATDLYSTPSLTKPVVWSIVTNPPIFSNSQWSVTVPTGAAAGSFYRLQQ